MNQEADSGIESGSDDEVPEPEPEISTVDQAKTRQVYDRDTGVFNMTKLRVTDLPENRKVILPKALSAKNEAKLEVRNDTLRKAFKEYRAANCDEKDRQKPNLPPHLNKALHSLRKKVKEGMLLLVPTDKSGKWAVTDRETYILIGNEHTKKDKEIDVEEVRRTQLQINGHTAM